MGSGFRLRAQTPAKRLKLSKSEVPTCRGPVRVETQIPSPRFVSKPVKAAGKKNRMVKETKVTKVGSRRLLNPRLAPRGRARTQGTRRAGLRKTAWKLTQSAFEVASEWPTIQEWFVDSSWNLIQRSLPTTT